MNCAECKELLVGYVEGFLDESQKQTVAGHLNSCRSCQTELEAVIGLRERLVTNGNILAQTALENDVMSRIVREQNVRLKTTNKISKAIRIRRIIMKNPIVKAAVAAAVVLACLAGLYLWIGTKSGVALADVLEKVEQAQAFMYKIKTAETGTMIPGMPAIKKESEGTVIVSNRYGTKMDMTETTGDVNNSRQETLQQYFLPDQKLEIAIFHKQKKYTQMEFDDDWLERRKKQSYDPRVMIKQIMNCKYTDLGRSEIDGVEVEGFKTTDPAFYGCQFEDVNAVLWVDVKNWLPVRMEMDFKMSKQIQISSVIYDYQWDVSVDANEFEPVIPKDYTALPTSGMKMPSMTEASAIEGLKFFADTFGHYPRKLTITNLMRESLIFKDYKLTLKDSNNLTETGLKLKKEIEQAKIGDELTKKMMEMMRPVQSLCIFYITLVQDKKDPAYYGKSVTVGDANAVLMRWKVSDIEYRVIYGDLTAETVTAEELAELEKNVSVDANEFEPVVPEGTTEIPITTTYEEEMRKVAEEEQRKAAEEAPRKVAEEMRKVTEESAIEGLKSFADILGHYPKNLNFTNLGQELASFTSELSLKDSNSLTEAGLKYKQELMKASLDKERLKEMIKETMKKSMEMMRPGMFYMKLVQEKKEPAYYGDVVGPNDADKVLLRWKISDSEYRVIFGDLRAETVTPEKLAELEGGLPK
jgi:outer membrane lipoprotein-sorting protein